VWISGRTSLLADLRRILRADLQQRVQKVLGVNLGALVAFHITYGTWDRPPVTGAGLSARRDQRHEIPVDDVAED
jgi:hypothetical protein